jgi:dTDP-4-dehydrorhamnose reductase
MDTSFRHHPTPSLRRVTAPSGRSSPKERGGPSLLVTGASGYLGRHLVARAGPAWRLVGTHLSTPPPPGLESYRLDIRDAAAIEALLDELRPEVVIHTAYRRNEPAINLEGARNLAAACERIGARLVFVSTDLVFDGRRGWYRESDPPSPIEPYGASKVAAEREVLRSGGRSRLFVDEFRCPAYAPDLAEALLELARGHPSAGLGQVFRGLLHLAGPQRLSRYEFGVKLARALGLDPAGLEPARQADSGLARSPDTSLDTGLARGLLRTRLRSVDEAVAGKSPLPGEKGAGGILAQPEGGA